MSEPWILELVPRPLERTEADLALTGFFEDERPLRGGAARADWRLCGALSKQIVDGELSGAADEALLLAGGPALRAPRLLVVGLGSRRDFNVARFAQGTAAALARARRLGCRRVACAPLGLAPDDLPRHAESMLDLLEAERASADAEAPLHVRICLRAADLPEAERAFETLLARRGQEAIVLRTPPPPPSRRPASPLAGASAGTSG